MCRGGAVISGNTITAIFLYEINDLAAQNARLHRGRQRQDTGFDEQLDALKDVKAVEKRSKTSGELVACHGCVFKSMKKKRWPRAHAGEEMPGGRWKSCKRSGLK